MHGETRATLIFPDIVSKANIRLACWWALLLPHLEQENECLECLACWSFAFFQCLPAGRYMHNTCGSLSRGRPSCGGHEVASVESSLCVLHGLGSVEPTEDDTGNDSDSDSL